MENLGYKDVNTFVMLNFSVTRSNMKYLLTCCKITACLYIFVVDTVMLYTFCYQSSKIVHNARKHSYILIVCPVI